MRFFVDGISDCIPKCLGQSDFVSIRSRILAVIKHFRSPMKREFFSSGKALHNSGASRTIER